MKPLNEVAENYFNTLNPIAERISADIVATKDAYEDLWNCLSTKEKNQIINETVVHPEAILKYTLSTKSCQGVSLDVPLLTRQLTGAKFIVDESTGLSWRDEHSGPFSWKTPSQIDLCLFSSSKDENEAEADISSHLLTSNNNKNKENFNSSEVDNSFVNVSNKEGIITKKQEKSEAKRKGCASLSSSNVVLVGTCSKLTGFCSRLKFLPTKSYTYEVQTVVTNSSSDGSFLDKLKSTAVCKIQSTLKLVGGRSAAEKKAADLKETETLVHPKGTATVVRLSKPSPKISKPKSPPPPPPVVKPTPKNDEKEVKNLISIRNSKVESQNEKDSEKVTLLGENSVESFLSAEGDSLEQVSKNTVAHELSDDLNSISTECTPLSGPSTDVIPKSGFDFLDNWESYSLESLYFFSEVLRQMMDEELL